MHLRGSSIGDLVLSVLLRENLLITVYAHSVCIARASFTHPGMDPEAQPADDDFPKLADSSHRLSKTSFAYRPIPLSLPVHDSTVIHATAAVEFALS